MNHPPAGMPAWPQQNQGPMPMGGQPAWGQPGQQPVWGQPGQMPMDPNVAMQANWGQPVGAPMPGGYPQMQQQGWGQQQHFPMQPAGPKCPPIVIVIGIIYLVFALFSVISLATRDFGDSEVSTEMIIQLLAEIGILIGATLFAIGLLKGAKTSALRHAEIFGKVMFYLTLVALLLFGFIYLSLEKGTPVKQKDSLFYLCVILFVQLAGWGCAAFTLGREKIIYGYGEWVGEKSIDQPESGHMNPI